MSLFCFGHRSLSLYMDNFSCYKYKITMLRVPLNASAIMWNQRLKLLNSSSGLYNAILDMKRKIPMRTKDFNHSFTLLS